ncbi:MAG: ATP-binding cassette domain-containing protein [Clostridia bacterium]|nr:ATP-binding cassette domain-containing protein [Clostridia bacterium]
MKISKLTSFDILERPAKVASFAKKIIVIQILGTVIPVLFSFALTWAKSAYTNGYIAVSILLLVLYFAEQTLESIGTTITELKSAQFQALTTSESTKIVLNLNNTVKSKVFKKSKGNLTMVEDSEITQQSLDYLSSYWNLQILVPVFISQIIVILATLAATIVTVATDESSTTLEVILTTSMLIASIFLYIPLTRKRIKVMRKYRKVKQDNKAKTEVLKTEIKTIDFISEKDFTYHAEKLRTALDENITAEKDENLKLNKVFIERSFLSSMIMIILIGINLYSRHTFTLESIFGIVAFSQIFSRILREITHITDRFERVMNTVVEMEGLYDSFKNIYTVYEREMNKKIISSDINTVTIDEFTASQDPNGVFSLINTNLISINSGDTYLVYGHTGCGKSTFLYLLTGKLNLQNSPIIFSNGDSGYLNSIAYQTDKSMANNFVVNEIAITDDINSVDIVKFFSILNGLHLYTEVLQMLRNTEFDNKNWTDDMKVFNFLQARKTKQFSSGQMQRLALAKLLYNLSDTNQLVALDEPFNRLDDQTATSCMEFIQQYIMKRNRILILATHQVEICRSYSNHEIYFEEDVNKSYLKTNS